MGVIIRQSIKGTLVNYLGVAIGFVTTFFVITSYLTTEEVGLTRVLIDAAVLFSSFAQIGTSSSIIRFFPYFKDEEGKNHGFFFWTLVVPLVGFLVFTLVFLLFKQPIINLFSEKSPLFVNYFRFVIPLGLFMLYQSVFEANANVLMRIVVPKFVREVGVRAGLLIIYLLFGYHYINLDGLVVGFCITYFIAALIDIIYLFTLQKISLKPDLKFITKPLVRDFCLYTFFLVLAAIAGNITPLLSSFFVSAKMGLGFTGVYAIANYIATVIEVPNRSLNAIANPKISEAVKNEDWKQAELLCKNVSLHLFLSSLFIFLIIWINVDLLFMVLKNGEDYVTGKSVIFILGLARLSNSVLSPGASPLAYSKYYYMSLVFTVLLTASAILLNIWLIPKYGMNGSAFANFGSYLIYFVCLLTLVRWKLHISIFSWGQLKSLVVVLLLFGLNALWVKTLSPLFDILPFKALITAIIEGTVRTGVLLIIGMTIIYFWHISPEINGLIEKSLRKLKRH
ncbi:MAG: oligosaccharide flippase family protein [Bacteroidales bacterium]|nr:oligosaccharide flippase family protein [Bacteroidales bacterium]